MAGNDVFLSVVPSDANPADVRLVDPTGAALAINGALSASETGDTLVASGVLAITGSLSVTEAGDTLTAAGVLAITGTLSITEAPDVATSAGALAITGATTATEAPDTLAAFLRMPAPVFARVFGTEYFRRRP